MRCRKLWQRQICPGGDRPKQRIWCIPWLVGGSATPLKNMNVNWDDEIPNINGKIQKMATKPPTRWSHDFFEHYRLVDLDPATSSCSRLDVLGHAGNLSPKKNRCFNLVGGWATPLKNMLVSWDDEIPNINGKIQKNGNQTTNQQRFVDAESAHLDWSGWPCHALLFLPPQNGLAIWRFP